MGGRQERQSGDRPVYVCLGDTEMAKAIASELRDHGLRARAFAQTALMANAASTHPPSSVICDLHAGPMPAVLAGDDTTDLIALVDDDDLSTRLKVANRGFRACFPLPLNRTALIHRLREGSRERRETRRIAAVTTQGSPLDAALAELPPALDVVRLAPEEELIRALETSGPALVILDGDMPDVNTFDLAVALRQHQPLTPIPFILATVGDKRRFDRLAQRCGIDTMLGLPIDATDLEGILLARIQRAETLAEIQGYAAQRDLRTGLFHRRYLVEALPRALTASARTGDAVTLVRIKIKPDRGQPDMALAVAAERVQDLQPPLALAARLSDDEIALLGPCRDDKAAERLLTGLRSALTGVEWDDDRGGGYLSADFGMAMADGHDQSVSALVRKAAARPTGATATPKAQREADAPMSDYWRQVVEQALRENRFQLVYQPISSLSGHPGALFEVFVRLLDEERRQIRPAEFLPAAREAGLGRELDRWVLSHALHVLAEQGSGADGPTLFVKLLPESLADERLASWLGGLIREEAIAPARLIIEISHAALLSRQAEATALMSALSDLGCGVAIEHFDDRSDDGAVLSAGGFQYLKLAGGLTSDLLGDRDAAARVARITKHARERDIRTIASLVQDAGALSILWQTGVDYIQGYFMQEPSAVFNDS